jgi:putative spermidine/putrescine transport system substrate-binding protein
LTFHARVLRRSSLAVLAAAMCIAGAGCGGSDDSGADASGGSADASRFPESTFKPEIFGNLSGTVTWHDGSGGATTKSRESSIYKNFTDLTGVAVRSDYNSDTTKFFAAMEAGQAQWDVIEFPTYGDFLRAKEQGYLEKLDPSIVPVDKLEDGTYDEYGYRYGRYGVVLTYNTEKFEEGKAPTSMKDLYNTEDFPGKRCMYKYPEFGATLESALLADGVAKEDLYPLDVDRALKKLDTIKDDIVWWSSGDDAVRLLTTGECDLGVAWTGRAYNAVTKDNAPLAITWQDGMYLDAAYAIPKGSPNAKNAQAMLAMWILDEQGQQDFLKGVPYPTPIKGLEYPAELAPWLPAGENLDKAVASDDAYFAENINDLTSRFTKWVGE